MSAAIDDRVRALESQIEGQTNPLWYYILGQRPLDEALLEVLEDLLEDYPDEDEIGRRDALEDVSNALAAAKDALEEDCDTREAARRMREVLEKIEGWVKEANGVVEENERGKVCR